LHATNCFVNVVSRISYHGFKTRRMIFHATNCFMNDVYRISYHGFRIRRKWKLLILFSVFVKKW